MLCGGRAGPADGDEDRAHDQVTDINRQVEELSVDRKFHANQETYTQEQDGHRRPAAGEWQALARLQNPDQQDRCEENTAEKLLRMDEQPEHPAPAHTLAKDLGKRKEEKGKGENVSGTAAAAKPQESKAGPQQGKDR